MNRQFELDKLFLFNGVEKKPDFSLLPPAVKFLKGEDIYNATGFRRALGVVLEGRAEASAVGQDSTVLCVFTPGSVFGAAALFGGKEYVSHITAVSACRIQFIPEEVLRQWFESDSAIAVNYIAFLTGRVRFLNGKISLFTSDSVEGRLYAWLSANCDDNGNIPRSVSMTALAGILHIGRTSLYRALGALEEKQLLSRKDGKVCILR